jgi:hypothetical protein
MARIDDCSILQTGHLVKNRLGGMHDSISVQNLISHNFACTSSQANSHATKEHLAWHDMRQTRVSGGTPYPDSPCRSRSSNVWSGELTLYTVQPWHEELITSGETLSSTNWARSRSKLSKPWMFYELSTRCPQSWALGWEPLDENPDCLSGLVSETLLDNGFECLSPWG